MIGEIINGKYKIVSAFSESHMYELFTALEIDTGATVVLKLLKEEMAVNPERVKSFSEEIRSFASISHPTVAEILDVDIFEDRPFVVTPLVKGRELNNVIKEQTLSFADCCKIINDLASVLQFAAAQNVECRTIKLSNVLRDKTGKITVLSFTHPRLKLASSASKSEHSGIHSDLFFLGGTLFELLSGESIIRRRGGIHELWDMKLETNMRIRHQDLTPEQISKTVEFVRKALTRDMKLRFNSHEEFLKALSDLTHLVRGSVDVKSKLKQLSMASQVVDAINGRMSNVNTAKVPAVSRTAAPAVKEAAAGASMKLNRIGEGKSKAAASSDDTLGFAEIDGNLAVALDTDAQNAEKRAVSAFDLNASELPAAERKRPPLRLLKAEKAAAGSNETWSSHDDAHWLKNPVIFMGLTLVFMVCLILFW